MRQALPSRQAPNLVIVACLISVFLLGVTMVGAHTAVAAVADAGCTSSGDQTVLVGLAGNTLSLLAKESLGLLKVGAGTMATLTLALARNVGGIGLWVYAVYLAMMSHLALIVASVLLLSVVYTHKGSRH